MPGFFARLFRIFRGKANDSLNSLEDATFSTTLKQSVADLKEELGRVIEASAEAIAHADRLSSDHRRMLQEADDWREKAKLALSRSDEALARKALEKEVASRSRADALLPSVERSKDTAQRLRQQVDVLRHKVEEAERNADTLIARKAAADAERKVSEAVAGFGDAENAFSSIKQFETRVEKSESVARAYAEFAEPSEEKQLNASFAALLPATTVDAELEKLKKEIAA